MASATKCQQRAEECRSAMAEASLSERLTLNALAQLWSELAVMAGDTGQAEKRGPVAPQLAAQIAVRDNSVLDRMHKLRALHLKYQHNGKRPPD